MTDPSVGSLRVRRGRLPGVHVVDMPVHTDQRGSFGEVMREPLLEEITGRPFGVQQVSVAHSRAGVLRGIHVTDVPPGQAKVVMCATGRIVDALIDLRVGSPTFGQHELFDLVGAGGTRLIIPDGVGHAYCALEDHSTVVYVHSRCYDPAKDRDIDALDPQLAIAWPRSGRELVRSSKDEEAPSLQEALDRSFLPRFADCPAEPGWSADPSSTDAEAR